MLLPLPKLPSSVLKEWPNRPTWRCVWHAYSYRKQLSYAPTGRKCVTSCRFERTSRKRWFWENHRWYKIERGCPNYSILAWPGCEGCPVQVQMDAVEMFAYSPLTSQFLYLATLVDQKARCGLLFIIGKICSDWVNRSTKTCVWLLLQTVSANFLASRLKSVMIALGQMSKLLLVVWVSRFESVPVDN